jgi:small subunit ribosomal protein S20
MPNLRSSEKSVRQTLVRTRRNRGMKSRVRTFRKKALVALAKGDPKAAQEAYDLFASAADKAAKKKTLHRNTASRLKSRLAAAMNKAAKKP